MIDFGYLDMYHIEFVKCKRLTPTTAKSVNSFGSCVKVKWSKLEWEVGSGNEVKWDGMQWNEMGMV